MTATTLAKYIVPVAMVASLGLATAADACSQPKPDCDVTAINASSGSRFTINGLTVTGYVDVTGPKTCKVPVTITTWQAPNPKKGKPYDKQTLYQFTTATFGVGDHAISTQLPNCDYQVDLLRGTDPTGTNGTPLYPKGTLMASLHGGTQQCVDPTPSPSPSPSPTPTPSVTPTPAPAPSLPDTGSSTGAMVGLMSMIGAGIAYWRTRLVRG